MSNLDLVSRMREGRRSPAVLKISLSQIRSARPDIAVLIFEGREDVGVYDVWIGRCSVSLEYEPLPGNGKDQLLGFRRMLRADTTGLSRAVYFFVDRDFDGLKGESPGPDIYVLNAYSVENHLAHDAVVSSLLIDEFRCAGDFETRASVLSKYISTRAKFHSLVSSINFRLYVARKAGIRVLNLEDSITRFVSVGLTEVSAVNDMTAQKIVRLEREPSENELSSELSEFEAMNAPVDYRGKYEFQFLVSWVRLLAEDRSSDRPQLFPERESVPNILAALSMRSCAGRAPLPSQLNEFVSRICPV